MDNGHVAQVTWECLAIITDELREIKELIARTEAKKEVHAEPVSTLGWVSVTKYGYPRRDTNTGCSIDVLLGAFIGGRIWVVGWGYYSHSSAGWYVASNGKLPNTYWATQEKITHYLVVPKYPKE